MSEFFVADVAEERLFAGVYEEVLSELLLRVKGFAAVLARVILFARVVSHVGVQVARAAELLAAGVAHKRSFSVVDLKITFDFCFLEEIIIRLPWYVCEVPALLKML